MENSKPHNDIELRSEKVRNIIGQIPPRILRIGISIITLAFLMLFFAAWFFPYKESIKFQSEIYKSSTVSDSISSFYFCLIPSEQISIVSPGQPIQFNPHSVKSIDRIILRGRISEIDPIPQKDINGKYLYRVKIEIDGSSPYPKSGIIGEISVVTYEGSFLKKMLF